MTRALVLTPQIGGADGISAVGRQIVAALRHAVGRDLESLEVWSLHDDGAPPELRHPCLRFRAARGARVTFAVPALSCPAGPELLVLVLHAHLLPAALPLVSRGARLVALLLGIEAWRPLTALQRAALRRAWRVASISRHTAERFRAANPALADLDIQVCHPGVNGPGTYNPGDANDSSDPKAKPVPFALMVGRMSKAERYKGHDELLEVWPVVRAAVPGARLVVAGTGDDEARLRAKAQALGPDAGIHFQGGVGHRRKAELYRRAAFFVMPSRGEGFGLVFLEAMQAGIPCIAGCGAPEEIVEAGVSGIIVDPGDRRVLADAMIRLFTDAPLREAMGRAAARRVREQFGPAQFASRLFTLLDLPLPVAEAAAC